MVDVLVVVQIQTADIIVFIVGIHLMKDLFTIQYTVLEDCHVLKFKKITIF